MAGKRRGPPPEPSKLQDLKGNPGHRPINTLEPVPPPGAPDAPAHLADEAKREWERVVGVLDKLGLATVLDRAALAAYCQAWSHWIEAEGNLKKYGAVIKSPSGFPMLSPYVTLATTALKQMRDFLTEFGMTPASRTRLEVAAPAGLGDGATPDRDPHDELEARRKARAQAAGA